LLKYKKKQIMKKVKVHGKEIIFMFVLLNILYFMKNNKPKMNEEKIKQEIKMDEKKVVIKKQTFEEYSILLVFFIFSNIFIYYSKSKTWSVDSMLNFVYYIFINFIQYIFFDKMLKHFLFYMNNMKESTTPEHTKQFLEVIIDELIKLFDRNLQVFIFGGKILSSILLSSVNSNLKTWTEINHLYRTKSWKEIIGFILLYFLIRKFVFYLGVQLKEKISYNDPVKNKNKLILCAVCSIFFIVNFFYNSIYIQFLNFKKNKTFRIPDTKEIERNKNQFQRILNDHNLRLPDEFDDDLLYEEDYLNYYKDYADQNNIELSPILKTKYRINEGISKVKNFFKDSFV